MDMQTVMASTAHDVKNSLGLMINQLDDIYKRLDTADPEAAQMIRRIQLECSRINNDMVHLLGIYKVHKGRFAPAFDEVYVPDLIADVISRYREMLNTMEIGLDTSFDDEDCIWYLDGTLVEGLLSNIITNAIRYTDKHLQIDIRHEDGWLNIRIIDDGNGFPPKILTLLDEPETVCFESGATGLGLYFCQQIAQAHVNGERSGYIELSNDPETSGAVFDLWLP